MNKPLYFWPNYRKNDVTTPNTTLHDLLKSADFNSAFTAPLQPRYTYTNAALLMRAQPLHDQHTDMIRGALDCASRVLIVIGSAFEAQTLTNPFTYEMRRGMIEAAFPEETANGRLIIAGLEDYTYRTEKWAAEFYDLICRELNTKQNFVFYTFGKDKATQEYINDGLPSFIKRVYHKSKDATVNATDIRNQFFSAIPCLNIPHISNDVGFRLHTYKLTEEYDAFTRELAAIKAYNKSWEAAPFPPHFVAVDALVTWHDAWNKPYFLVGVRKSEFGNGKWCIPGGYLEVKETLLESAKRELLEETSLAVDDGFILDRVTTFDDPNRSKRGRMITHVHSWRCVHPTKPVVTAGDDLSDAFWLPFDEVYRNKRRFFSDHYPIIAKLHPTVEDFK